MLEDIQAIEDQQQFQETVLEAAKPVMVMFYAENCLHCAMLAPRFSELAQTYSGKIDFFKVETGQSPDLARRQEISATPTVKLYQHGKPTSTWVNETKTQRYRDVLDALAATRTGR